MRGAPALLRAAALAGLLALLPVPPAGADGVAVVAIDVRGARRTSPEAIRQAMATRTGSAFDPERIREDVKAIYRLGYFTDVRVDAGEAPGGVRLTVVVTERPIVAGVTIEGNKEVEAADLKEALTVKERSLFQEDKVKESARRLLEAYQNKGFFDAAVDPVVREEADGSVRVVFRIREGEKLKIVRIRVAGNRYFPADGIRKVMETGEKGFFSFLTDSGTFKKDVLENDVRRIEFLYQSNGFIDSKISDPEVCRFAGGLEVVIRIDEGRQYRVGRVAFSGESGIPEEELRRTVKLKTADVFSREKLLDDLLALTTALNDRGYAQALVSPAVEKRKEYPVADVTYRMERGERFRFGRVGIAGNAKTLDRVVRRELDVADGETYTASGLRTSKENLSRTGHFKDVKISTAPSATPGEMDVKVEVQEGPTGTLSGGLGFSSIDKLFGVINLTESNLFGRGWRTTLNLQFGTARRVLNLDFREPHLFDTDFSFNAGVYNTQTEYPDFEQRKQGGRIGLGYHISRVTTANLMLRKEDVLLIDTGRATSDILREEFAKGWQKTHSVGVTLSRSTMNRPIDPSRGTFSSVSAEFAGGPLGGDQDFLKYFLNGKVFYPLTPSAVFSANALWGQTFSTVGGTVSVSERFFLGGPYSIRGFEARSIAPVDPATGEAIGGNKEFVFNAEFLIALYGEIGLKGVTFFDMGNTWLQGEGPWNTSQPPGFRYGAGFGIRWYSPMGPLRFEWGWNLNPQPGEPTRVTEFTIGTAF